jgi:hypothetical protein
MRAARCVFRFYAVRITQQNEEEHGLLTAASRARRFSFSYQ